MTLLFAPSWEIILDPDGYVTLARGSCGETDNDFVEDISKWDGKQLIISAVVKTAPYDPFIDSYLYLLMRFLVCLLLFSLRSDDDAGHVPRC